jgi:sulfur carrier protein ThiS
MLDPSPTIEEILEQVGVSHDEVIFYVEQNIVGNRVSYNRPF